MEYKKHCAKSMELFNESGSEIHLFLDSYAKDFGWNHRLILHHDYGIYIIRKLFGEYAVKHAEQHIKDDCLGEIPNVDNWKDSDYWLNVI